ncbi:MAG TPA: cache domain-containing protein [Candidatus Sulfotelmatobacter sp.]|jgi:methyl-accepting chemotaxis protein|nr:cache domain-containing protein [Candidatus Sulfotelmatobacter sp.]
MIRKLSISLKLMSTVVGGTVGYTLVTLLALYFMYGAMQDERESKVRGLAETAHAIIAHEQDRVHQGEITEDEARKTAIRELRAIRYGGTEYFFVYDYDGNAQMVPPWPEREGKNFLAVKDANGVPFIQKLIEMAQKGGGAVFYEYSKPGVSTPQPKVSYAMGVPDWKWMVGTGLYMDDMNAQFWASAWKVVAVVSVIVLMALGWVFMLARHIAAPLVRLNEVTDRLAQRDYSADAVAVVGELRGDEIGTLARSIRVLRDEAREADGLRQEQERQQQRMQAEQRKTRLDMANQFEGSIQQVADSITAAAQQVHSAAAMMAGVSGEASGAAGEVVASADRAASNVQTVARAAEELASSISEISQQVGHSSSISAQAVLEAQRTDALVQGLGQAVAKIAEVSSLINDIASQTNLLALNATIEAARAGDMGKGFAVVASEVKHLANQTAKATDEISGQIAAVQTATTEAIAAISAIGGTIEKLNSAGDIIAQAVERQRDLTQAIAHNISEAEVSSGEVSQHLSQLSQANHTVQGASGEVVHAAEGMVGQSGRLGQEVAVFLKSVRG